MPSYRPQSKSQDGTMKDLPLDAETLQGKTPAQIIAGLATQQSVNDVSTKVTNIENGTTKVPRATNADNSYSSTLSSAIKQTDTRETNELPPFYYTKAQQGQNFTFEFKKTTAIGLTGQSTYCQLQTYAKWADQTSGNITQIAVVDKNCFIRTSTGSTGWGAWDRLILNSEIGNGTITINQSNIKKGSFTLNQINNLTIDLTDTNTSHSHSVGKGLKISGSGDVSGTTTYSANLANENALTGDKIYNVGVNSAGNLAVQVPWSIPNITIATATGSGNAITSITSSGHTITPNKGANFALSSHTHTKSQITDFPDLSSYTKARVYNFNGGNIYKTKYTITNQNITLGNKFTVITVCGYVYVNSNELVNKSFVISGKTNTLQSGNYNASFEIPSKGTVFVSVSSSKVINYIQATDAYVSELYLSQIICVD